MIRLFRIRLIGLILLTTLVSMASYFYAKHVYTKTTYRYVLQAPLPAVTRPAGGPLNNGRATASGTIVTFKPVRQVETTVDYEQLRKDVVAVGLVLLIVYSVVLLLNHRLPESPAR